MTTIWQPAVILRFTGPRFEAASPDFDVAAELSAYKAIVVKVAEVLWRARNAGRSRLPKGFSSGMLLRFREVRRGGVVTVLERGCDGGDQLLIPIPGGAGEDEIERAINLLLEAISAVGRGEPVPDALPKEVLPLFGSWGRQLGADERCELSRPSAVSNGTAGTVFYGQAERIALLRLCEGLGLDATEQVGYVPSIGRGSFELYTDLEHGDAIEVPLRAEHEPLVVVASREYERVRVRGLGLFDEAGRLLRMVEVDAIEVAGNPRPWGGAESLWDGLPALSKTRPADDTWMELQDGVSENLNAYVYGIGR